MQACEGFLFVENYVLCFVFEALIKCLSKHQKLQQQLSSFISVVNGNMKDKMDTIKILKDEHTRHVFSMLVSELSMNFSQFSMFY